MSTTKAPKKDKPISDNWEIIKGGLVEQPDSFDFTDEKNIVLNNNKGMRGIGYTLTKRDILILLLKGTTLQKQGKNYFGFIANGKIKLVVKCDGWLENILRQDLYLI